MMGRWHLKPQSSAARIVAPVSLPTVDVEPPSPATGRGGVLGLPSIRLQRLHSGIAKRSGLLGEM